MKIDFKEGTLVLYQKRIFRINWINDGIFEFIDVKSGKVYYKNVDWFNKNMIIATEASKVLYGV